MWLLTNIINEKIRDGKQQNKRTRIMESGKLTSAFKKLKNALLLTSQSGEMFSCILLSALSIYIATRFDKKKGRAMHLAWAKSFNDY